MNVNIVDRLPTTFTASETRMETVQKAARLNAPVHDVGGSGHLGLPQQTPAQALFIENLRNRYVIKRITRSAPQETAMASALL